MTSVMRFHASVSAASRFRFTVLAGISAERYRAIARRMDIGLALKLSWHSYAQTTFPSKVIELAAMGMLVCTTSISDIPDIFEGESAILLSAETPVELAAALREAATDRTRSAARARNGRARVLERFSRARVGAELGAFLLR